MHRPEANPALRAEIVDRLAVLPGPTPAPLHEVAGVRFAVDGTDDRLASVILMSSRASMLGVPSEKRILIRV